MVRVQSHTHTPTHILHMISVFDARCGRLHTCCGQETVSADSCMQTPDKSWQTQSDGKEVHICLLISISNLQHQFNCLVIHQPERLPNGEATQHLQSWMFVSSAASRSHDTHIPSLQGPSCSASNAGKNYFWYVL